MKPNTFINELKKVLDGKEPTLELQESIQEGINKLKLETTQFNGELGNIVSINKDGVHWMSEKGKLYTNLSLNEIRIFSLTDNMKYESFLDELNFNEASTVDVDILERPTKNENESEFYVKYNNKILVLATQTVNLKRKSVRDKKFNLDWNFDNIEKVFGVMNYDIEDELEKISDKQNMKFSKTIISTHLKNILSASKSKKGFTENNDTEFNKIVWSTKTRNNTNITIQKDVKLLSNDKPEEVVKTKSNDLTIEYLKDTMNQFLNLADNLSQQIYNLQKDITNIQNESMQYKLEMDKKLSQMADIKTLKESISNVEKTNRIREKDLFIERVLLNFSEREKALYEKDINNIKASENDFDIIKNKLLTLIKQDNKTNVVIENTIDMVSNNKDENNKTSVNNVSNLNLDVDMLESYMELAKNITKKG